MSFPSQGIFAEKLSQKQDGDLSILPALSEKEMAKPEEQIIALAEYVRKVMKENNLTVYAVEREVRRRKGTMGKSTVDAVIQGKIKNPGIYTLRQLAWGLSRPLDEILAVVLGASIDEDRGFRKSRLAIIWELSRSLPLSEQRIFERFVQMLERELRRALSGD